MKVPYKTHPYDTLKAIQCPWIDDLTEHVINHINEYDEFIVSEASADKCRDFANEDFLYERFVDNLRYGMVYPNFEVLKYFNLFFEKKILLNMIGKWMYTDHDVEMYNYFSKTKFNESFKKVGNVMKYVTEHHPEFFTDDDIAKWKISLTTSSYGDIEINYIELFYDQLILCNDMIRNAKGLEPYQYNRHLFDLPTFFNLYNYKDVFFGNCIDCKTI